MTIKKELQIVGPRRFSVLLCNIPGVKANFCKSRGSTIWWALLPRGHWREPQKGGPSAVINGFPNQSGQQIPSLASNGIYADLNSNPKGKMAIQHNLINGHMLKKEMAFEHHVGLIRKEIYDTFKFSEDQEIPDVMFKSFGHCLKKYMARYC